MQRLSIYRNHRIYIDINSYLIARFELSLPCLPSAACLREAVPPPQCYGGRALTKADICYICALLVLRRATAEDRHTKLREVGGRREPAEGKYERN